MSARRQVYIMISLVFALQVAGQQKLEFAGQLSTVANYCPGNVLDVLLGGRYIPELNYRLGLPHNRGLDFNGSVNLSGSVSFLDIDSLVFAGNLRLYRLWGRFSGRRYEMRVGLQKIDFGSALLLRPLQWFNQIDPRDPLQLTYGVYGMLGRYYFQNNANIWLWVLYGNDEARGVDILPTYSRYPEFGGRGQYPVPSGEIALSYNHRTADSRNIHLVEPIEKIPEDRFGLDGKWDLEIGLWFEASYVHRWKNVGVLTNQTMVTVGVDYTFGIGNGLNVVAEHLITTADEKPFVFSGTSNTTALSMSYPLGLFDNISGFFYYSWTASVYSAFVNYEHQFKYVRGYIMVYYNASGQQDNQRNDVVNELSGPGIRLMLVYNH